MMVGSTIPARPALFNLLLTFSLGMLFCPAPAGASSLRDPAFMRGVQEGFHHIYNLDYSDALQVFESLQREHPLHPGPPLYLATAIWLREMFVREEIDLDLFVAPSYFDRPTPKQMPASDRSRFFSLIDESRKLAEGILRKDPDNNDAHYFLGSTEGILASFSITIDRNKRKAFGHGKKAYRTHLALIRRDPEFHDAYMSVGLYEYVVGSLPWYIKWIAAILGYSGSKERGLEFLSRAATHGQFVAADAMTLEILLLVRERRFQEALDNLLELQKGATRNFILKLNQAQIYQKMGERRKSLDTYLEILRKSESAIPNFDRIPLAKMRFLIARQFLQLESPEQAVAQFLLAAESPDLSDAQKSFCHLTAGQQLDRMGRREEAVRSYWQVLEFPDFDRAHSQAKKYLKRPYSRE